MDSQLNDLKQSLASAVEGMSDEQTRWHREGKWCAAEILEHLYLTYTGTIRGFQKVLESGKPLASQSTLRHRMRKMVVIGFGHMPSGREAPPMARPKGLPADKVKSELEEKLAAMDAIIGECEARFGRSTKLLDHPILGPLTAAQWRKFHVVHGLHHCKQLTRLNREMRRSLD